MAKKHDLTDWVAEALQSLGGSASLVAVAKEIWRVHEGDLRESGDLFYTWQYDMRWAANILRHNGTMRAAVSSPNGVWQLAS